MSREKRKLEIQSATSVNQAWKDFAKAVFPKDAPPIQYQEMMRSFYAGYYSSLMGTMLMATPEISEDDACKLLDKLRNECESFFEALQIDS
jgi:hypothetical protein